MRAQPVLTEVAAQAAEPILSTLAQTTLGAVALLSVIVAVFAVVKLSNVQDAATVRAEKAGDKITEVVTGLTGTLAGVDKTIAALTSAEKDSQKVMQDMSNLLQQMKNSIDTVIRDAVKR